MRWMEMMELGETHIHQNETKKWIHRLTKLAINVSRVTLCKIQVVIGGKTSPKEHPKPHFGVREKKTMSHIEHNIGSSALKCIIL